MLEARNHEASRPSFANYPVPKNICMKIHLKYYVYNSYNPKKHFNNTINILTSHMKISSIQFLVG